MVSFVLVLFKDHPEDCLSGFSVELLQGEYCINAIDCIYVVKCKNVIFANFVILLFRYSVFRVFWSPLQLIC